MSRGSIRRQITVLATLIAAAVLVALATVVVVVQQGQLNANLDRSLEQRADPIEAAIVADESAPLANSNQEDRFIQVLGAGGEVLHATDNLLGAPPIIVPTDVPQAFETRSDLPIEDDTYRVMTRRINGAEDASWLVVGENIDDVRDSVRNLIRTLALLIPAAVALLAATTWWLVGRTLSPVEQIRSEVASIGLEQLDRRVPVSHSDDEIGRLASTMNEMLARLESSSSRQRQFVADASHELRTPLTRIRLALEVDLARPNSDFEATCRSVLRDTIEMQTLVDDLLFLARHDAAVGSTVARPVDLDVVVHETVRRQREMSDVPIDMSEVEAVIVRGNEPQLRRLVQNLLSNAVRHASTRVAVAVTESGGDAQLVVSDDGPGIPVDQRSRVFERFVRLDEARSAREGGSGLGLAIALEIVTAHGGTIEIGTSPLGGAAITVTLPRQVQAEI
jgi:signal transduction histidine kinase